LAPRSVKTLLEEKTLDGTQATVSVIGLLEKKGPNLPRFGPFRAYD